MNKNVSLKDAEMLQQLKKQQHSEKTCSSMKVWKLIPATTFSQKCLELSSISNLTLSLVGMLQAQEKLFISGYLTWGQFHKHFMGVTHNAGIISYRMTCLCHVMRVTYNTRIISCTIMYAPIQCFQNSLTHFATAISYEQKMFMKLTPGLIS